MNIIAIIQARTNSERLPRKVLQDITGQPLICRVVERARRINGINGVWVATSDAADDDELSALCAQRGIPVFRGSKEDVLKRYVQAGRQAKADAVVRLTGDCPLLDPLESEKVVMAFREGNYDLVSNSHPPSYPDGLDTTVIALPALGKAYERAALLSEREHVVPYLYAHPEEFRHANIFCERDLSSYRWTVDEADDLQLIREIFIRLQKKGQFGYLHEVLALFAEDPQLFEINNSHIRNEGYQRSLDKERDNG